MAAPLILSLSSFLVACATAQTYTLSDNWYGTGFFNNFDFFTAADPTHGYVTYVSQSVAQATGLISATSDTAPVYMGADHTNVASGSGRNSVRITSHKAYNGGLFIIDLVHMPTGCGTWPAFWMTADDVTWPEHGEIDIIEGVNTNADNAATLHTNAGCSMSSVPTSSFSAHWGTSNNCDVSTNGNAGCGVIATQPNSYGTGFNNIQGGVYATLWDNSATGFIKVWFFPRSSIPSDIASGYPNPSGWGLPMANFQLGSNCPTSHFQNQKIIFDLTFCGDWAGSVFPSSGCGPNCNNFVQYNPSQFVESYWIINSVKVYAQSTSPPRTCTTWTDSDNYGNDIQHAAQPNADACCSWCQTISGCKAWSYYLGVCYLKSAAAAARTSVTGCITGVVNQATCTMIQDADYYGDDIANQPQPNADACCPYCASVSGCTAWSYYQGVCYLKSTTGAGATSKTGCVAGQLASSFVEENSFIHHDFLETQEQTSSGVASSAQQTPVAAQQTPVARASDRKRAHGHNTFQALAP